MPWHLCYATTTYLQLQWLCVPQTGAGVQPRLQPMIAHMDSGPCVHAAICSPSPWYNGRLPCNSWMDAINSVQSVQIQSGNKRMKKNKSSVKHKRGKEMYNLETIKQCSMYTDTYCTV